MGKLRFLFALWMAKLSIPALKITRHNGTDFPGSLAVKLCPDFLKYIGRPDTIVAVTGTNGKTTVANMLGDVLTAEGKNVLSNRAGSNIISGVSTALLKGCDLLIVEPDKGIAVGCGSGLCGQLFAPGQQGTDVRAGIGHFVEFHRETFLSGRRLHI